MAIPRLCFSCFFLNLSSFSYSSRSSNPAILNMYYSGKSFKIFHMPAFSQNFATWLRVSQTLVVNHWLETTAWEPLVGNHWSEITACEPLVRNHCSKLSKIFKKIHNIKNNYFQRSAQKSLNCSNSHLKHHIRISKDITFITNFQTLYLPLIFKTNTCPYK